MSIGIFETPEEQQEFVSRIGNLRSKFAMLDAERQAALGDPRRLNALLQEQRRVKVETEEELKRKQLDNFAKQNPQFAEMYKIFGEKGLQTAYLDSVAAQRQEQEKKQLEQTYISAGMNPQLASLIASGVDPEIAQDLLGGDTDQDIIDNINKQVELTEQKTNYQDIYANLDQAFSPADGIQDILNKGLRSTFGVEIAPATGSAIRARNALNTEIMGVLAGEFKDRPTSLIYQEIFKNLPRTTFTSEKDAYEQYYNNYVKVIGKIDSLEESLKSSVISETKKAGIVEDLFKAKELSKRLESALSSLNPEGKDIKKEFYETEETSESEQISGTGQFRDFYRQ